MALPLRFQCALATRNELRCTGPDPSGNGTLALSQLGFRVCPSHEMPECLRVTDRLVDSGRVVTIRSRPEVIAESLMHHTQACVTECDRGEP
eukprot:1722916-Rhodomonas_salina.2